MYHDEGAESSASSMRNECNQIVVRYEYVGSPWEWTALTW